MKSALSIDVSNCNALSLSALGMTGFEVTDTGKSYKELGSPIHDLGPTLMVSRCSVTIHTDGDVGASTHCGHLTE